jgi:hypothetical protein
MNSGTPHWQPMEGVSGVQIATGWRGTAWLIQSPDAIVPMLHHAANLPEGVALPRYILIAPQAHIDRMQHHVERGTAIGVRVVPVPEDNPDPVDWIA